MQRQSPSLILPRLGEERGRGSSLRNLERLMLLAPAGSDSD